MAVRYIFGRMVAIIVLAGILSACGGSETLSSAPVGNLTAISITPSGSAIALGTSLRFTATGIYSSNTRRDITTSVIWTSSDETIATISNTPGSQGVATSLMSIGSTTITASSESISGIATLSTSTVTSIAVSPASASIAPGTQQQYNAQGTLESGDTQDLTTWADWTSSNQTIALIESTSGLATAGTIFGSATISAFYTGVTGTAALISSPVISIAVSPATASIAKGTTQQFTASGTLADGAGQSLTTWATWTSSNTGVATISNTATTKGLVTSVNTGTTFISASFDSVSSPSAALAVTPAILSSITITPSSSNIPLGKTLQFAASGTFSDGSKQDISSSVTWGSSKTGVATISTTGLATSISEGTTAITASSSGFTSNTAALTVTPPELVSIQVTPSSASIVIGTTQQFTATGTYTDGSSKNITGIVGWTSSNTSVATMNTTEGFQGVAIASPFQAGSTIITASFSGITSNNAVLTVTLF